MPVTDFDRVLPHLTIYHCTLSHAKLHSFGIKNKLIKKARSTYSSSLYSTLHIDQTTLGKETVSH